MKGLNCRQPEILTTNRDAPSSLAPCYRPVLVFSDVHSQETARLLSGSSRTNLSGSSASTDSSSIFSKQTPPAQRPGIISGDKLTNPAQIVSGFASNRSVKVIINLATSATAAKTDFASRTSLVTLQSEIKQLQTDVLAFIPATEIKVDHRFENIAGFSAEVTMAGLTALQADARVLSIEPDLAVQAHLAQGIPLIHGMTYRFTYNGDGVAIAICDTGVDYTHRAVGWRRVPKQQSDWRLQLRRWQCRPPA